MRSESVCRTARKSKQNRSLVTVRRLFCWLSLFLFIMLPACYENNPDILEIERLRADYAGLNAAALVITGGEARDAFYLFRYEGELLTYFYSASDGGENYQEYSNGYRLICRLTTGERVTFSPGDSDYYSYNRQNPHPMFSEKTIYFTKSGLTKTRTATDGWIYAEYGSGTQLGFFAEDGHLRAYRQKKSDSAEVNDGDVLLQISSGDAVTTPEEAAKAYGLVDNAQ